MPRKRFDVHTEARKIKDAILATPDIDIPQLFADMEVRTTAQRCDVFIMLDEKPGYFGGDYWDWHAPLRRCRNHHGTRLFDAINKRGEFA